MVLQVSLDHADWNGDLLDNDQFRGNTFVIGEVASAPEMWQTIWIPITQAGVGAVLLAPVVWWFAMRMERIMERNTQAVERNTVSNMVSVLNTKRLDEALAAMATKVKEEAEKALQK